MYVVELSAAPQAAKGIQPADQGPTRICATAEIRHILAARCQSVPIRRIIEMQADAAELAKAVSKDSRGQALCLGQTRQFPGVQTHHFAMAANVAPGAGER